MIRRWPLKAIRSVSLGIRLFTTCSRCLASVSKINPHPVPLVSQPVRTRFAPSPTGALHLGSLRTALFNYLLAKHYDGQFILRIEDTDATRTIPGAMEQMCSLLNWAGIEWDEGPGVGGVQGPYRQSERLKIYKGMADCLIDSNRAYRCFCSPERLEKVRTESRRWRAVGSYDRHCLEISAEESKLLAKNEPYVVRLKAPPEWPVVNDFLRGDVNFRVREEFKSTKYFDDVILLKSDGWPTYHLACVVDDHLMEISHVIRGEEWLASTPKHLVLYDAFGWQPPTFVHLPLLHTLSGRKLSKRDTSWQSAFLVTAYRDGGILPEALVNYVALFGWSPSVGDDAHSDVYSMDDLIKLFTLKGLTTSSVKVSADKLPFLNHQHFLKKLSTEEGTKSLIEAVLPFLRKDLSPEEMPSPEYLSAVLKVCHERISSFKDIYRRAHYFFQDPNPFDTDIAPFIHKSLLQGSTLKDGGYKVKQIVGEILRISKEKFDVLQEWSSEELSKTIEEIGSETNQRPDVVMRLLRYAITGVTSGVGVPKVMEILGKEKVKERLRRCILYVDSTTGKEYYHKNIIN